MGFRLPEALAGDDNEVELSEDGARRVVELIAGVAGALGILTAGALVWQWVAGIVGTNKNVGDLY